MIEKDPRWSNFDGPEAIFRAPLPDIYSTMLHEMYHSLGLASNNSQYKKESGDNSFYFSTNKNSPIGIWD